MGKIKDFFIKIKPSKRKLIQVYAALLYNANLKGFITGKISTDSTKTICVPGMNCYSCPGAVGACPLGSLQNALSSSKTKAPMYVLGIILLYCIMFGRWICGWLCPGGLLQEWLYKIKTPKLKKNKVTRILSYFKYVLLIGFVFIIPIMFGVVSDKAIPAFCKYVCPIGTFEGAVFLLSNGNNANYFEMLGGLFTWKFILLILFIVGAIFIYRFFCRFFCPLGALYGIFNKISIFGIKVDKSKCTNCGSCITNCKMDVKYVGDHECIQCGECKAVCHVNAIDWKHISTIIREEKLAFEKTNLNYETITSFQGNSSETINNQYLNENNEVESNKVESKDKKLKKNRKKIVEIFISVIMLIVLITALIYYNVDWNKKTNMEVGETLSSLNVTLYDGSSVDLSKNDNKVTAIYFYNDYNKEEIEKIESDLNNVLNKINLYFISSYSNKDLNEKQIEEKENVVFAYDNDDSSALLKFNSKSSYPYYAWLDSDNVLQYSSSDNFKSQNYLIEATANGYKVGKEIGNLIYNATLTSIDYENNKSTISINDFKGKITIINFWATWCGPCVQELPYFEDLYENYKDYINVIAIHDGASYGEEETLNFIEARDYFELTWAYDDINSSFFKSLGGGDTLPMTVIIDQNGIITYNSLQSVTYELLESEIQKILNK